MNAQSQITLDSVTDVTVRNVLKDMLIEYERRTPFFQISLKAKLLVLSLDSGTAGQRRAAA
ncbi:Uncharacterised protein [Actinobacillus pleuropneumoniae]|nr:Uncharacterised protein [Actinobacillus pleuropneumoniae]